MRRPLICGVVIAALFTGSAAASPRPWSPDGASRRLPALAAAPRDALTRALESGAVTQARYALLRARSLFERDRGSAAADPRAATMYLRDLALRARDLSGEDADRARRLLARPTDGYADIGGHGYSLPAVNTCSEDICVHWVRGSRDAPPEAEAAVPPWVTTTLDTFQHVWDSLAEAGYRPPKSDSNSRNNGGSGRFDVYLADVGSDLLYGYCTTDDPNLNRNYGYYDLSAYCVVDNDFSSAQFGSAIGPLGNLRVTAAHEFFHAVQFAYDAFEDSWFMEGTAAWIEDLIYDEINDNYQYLKTSQLRNPHIPLDLGFSYNRPLYGSWLFWTFVTEYYGSDVVRDVWRLADGSPGGPDKYSIEAVAGEIKRRGWSLRKLFNTYAAYNYAPGDFYEEGSGYYASTGSPMAMRSFDFTSTAATSPPLEGSLDHLTAAYASFTLDPTVPSGRSIKVTVDLPDRFRGSAASLLALRDEGRPQIIPIVTNRRGNGVRTVATTDVARFVLVLSNGSRRMTCWTGSNFSCNGAPKDDDQPFRIWARLVDQAP